MVLTGDVTQIDLPHEKGSGLRRVADMLKNIDDIGITHLTNRDVVRHKLVREIIKAFEKYEDSATKKIRK